jgi:amino acid transporter
VRGQQAVALGLELGALLGDARAPRVHARDFGVVLVQRHGRVHRRRGRALLRDVGLERGLALLEGRLVEVMLGERMPRRPAYADRELPLLQRIGAMFTDPRTWSTLCYQLAMLPLGILYFTLAVTALSLSLSIALAPIAMLFDGNAHWVTWNGDAFELPWWSTPVTMLIGLAMLLLTMHGARAIGAMHGAIAKHLLVRSA